MSRIFAVFLLLFLGPRFRPSAQSPYESSADFAKYAMKLREQALLKVEPQVFVPTTSRTSITAFSVENEYRDHCFLDRGGSRRQ